MKRRQRRKASAARLVFLFDLMLMFLAYWSSFGSEARKRDAELVEMMTAVGSQIGQFIDRKRSENLLRESESRFRQLDDACPRSGRSAARRRHRLLQ